MRFSLLGKAVARLIGFCPVCVSWQKRSVTAPFGHRLSDELSEIILDHLHFDHRLTTTVQWHYKMLEKPVVTTNNGLFLVLAVNVHNQQNSRSNASLYHSVVVLRPGRPEVRILPVAPRAAPCGVLLFLFCTDFIGQQKGGFEQPVPRALRPAGQKRPGGAFLGRGSANPFGRTKKRIAMYFCNALFYSDFRIILVAYHLPHRCTVLLTAVHFSVDLQWYA